MSGRWASVGSGVELRDEQPKKHEIGNRTYIVADVEPLDVDGVRTVEVGTGAVAARVPGPAPLLRAPRGHRAPAGGSGPASPASGSASSGWSTAAAAGRPGRGPAKPDRRISRASEGLDLVRRDGVEHVVRQRLGLVLAGPAGPRSARRSRGRRRPPGRRRWRCRWRRRRTSPRAGRRSAPGSRTYAQVSGAAWASGDSGPPSPSYQRWAARSRPSSERVRTRPRPSSRGHRFGPGHVVVGRAGRRRRSTSARAAGRRPRPAAGRRATGHRAGCAPCRAPTRGPRSPRRPASARSRRR